MSFGSAKRALAQLGFPLTRALVRALPSRRLALAFLHYVFVPRIAWRPFETVATTKDGVRMHVRFPDLIQRFVYLFGEWEPTITRFVKQRLQAGDLFVDVGANVGYYTL